MQVISSLYREYRSKLDLKDHLDHLDHQEDKDHKGQQEHQDLKVHHHQDNHTEYYLRKDRTLCMVGAAAVEEEAEVAVLEQLQISL